METREDCVRSDKHSSSFPFRNPIPISGPSKQISKMQSDEISATAFARDCLSGAQPRLCGELITITNESETREECVQSDKHSSSFFPIPAPISGEVNTFRKCKATKYPPRPLLMIVFRERNLRHRVYVGY
ncbi:hypothetical protein CEXT_57281 [Caerostris extrusa]|uniref:Uncharacterized protein n=1 Tax=Caerostris extrusa TaxID=172846 RepID=A0AAV4ME82_CAEEX|nr:hypothetical protein CEXT_57281 [Caerostris extrusa]